MAPGMTLLHALSVALSSERVRCNVDNEEIPGVVDVNVGNPKIIAIVINSNVYPVVAATTSDKPFKLP